MTELNTPLMDRAITLAKLAENPEFQWDVIVIGGGIVGAGILQEATQRGLTALLVEQKDFAWGTSSRSSKMIHGGLRYIAQGDIKLTKDSLQERERLLKEMPGLVTRMGYYFVLRKKQFPGRFIMSALLSVYDWLGGIKDHRFYDKRATLEHFPDLASKNLTGCSYYTDSVVDDARLVMRVLQEASQAGAQLLNYVKATKLVKDPKSGQVIGVNIINNSGEERADTVNTQLTLKSSVIINATGAWADSLRKEVIDETRVRPLRGSHLVVSQEKLKVKAALTILHPSDKRPVFIFPWEGATIIGTTDLDHKEGLNNEASISQSELDYLLLAISHSFPNKRLTHEDIISTFSGVRPVISDDKDHQRKKTKSNKSSKAPSKERRDHAIWADKALITASGGKLTTFRLTAIKALEAAKPWLIKGLMQGTPTAFQPIEMNETIKNSFKQLPHDHLFRLYGRYGCLTEQFLTTALKAELTLIAPTQFCLAECRWSIKYESVIHLDDLLLRRTRLGLLLPKGAQVLFPPLAKIFAQELGWSATKWQDEVTRYNSLWLKFYYLPSLVK